MSIASRMPFDRSSSMGAGSFGMRNVSRIDSFSHPALLYGRIEARKSYGPEFFAIGYVAIGRKDLAFDKLEQAYSERTWIMNLLKVEPRLDSLRSDPRFADLLQR